MSSTTFRRWLLREVSGVDGLSDEGVIAIMGENSRCEILLVIFLPILAECETMVYLGELGK
jgi:hypothetical protein